MDKGTHTELLRSNSAFPLTKKGDGIVQAMLAAHPSFRTDDCVDVTELYPYCLGGKAVIRLNRLRCDINLTVRGLAVLLCYIQPRLAVSTINGHINILRRTFQAFGQRGNLDFRLLTFNDLEDYLNDRDGGRNQSAETKAKVCSALGLMYEVADAMGQTTLMDRKKLDSLRSHFQRVAKKSRYARRCKNVDDDYITSIDRCFEKLARDKTVPYHLRVASTVYRLAIWTGLRREELVDLRVNRLSTISIKNGTPMTMLSYTPHKLSHGGQIRLKAECWCLPPAIEAYKTLVRLRKENSAGDSDHLLVTLDGRNFTPRMLETYRDQLFVNYLLDEATKPHANITTRTIDEKELSIPSWTQIRVHLCTCLYDLGVPRAIIELGMSHLTCQMDAYYFRAKDSETERSIQNAQFILDANPSNTWDDDSSIGELLLMDIVETINSYDCCCSRIIEMTKSGYEKEKEEYINKRNEIVSTRILPVMTYIDQTLKSTSMNDLLKRHPQLSIVWERLQQLKNQIK